MSKIFHIFYVCNTQNIRYQLNTGLHVIDLKYKMLRKRIQPLASSLFLDKPIKGHI